MIEHELIPHLFRTEFSKITAVLCKLFGVEHIETAEDIAKEHFQKARSLAKTATDRRTIQDKIDKL